MTVKNTCRTETIEKKNERYYKRVESTAKNKHEKKVEEPEKQEQECANENR